MEKSGYDVAYSTDVDTHTDGGRLLNCRGVLSAGHDGYWSKPMYDAFIAARDAGVHLGFFSANAVNWQARFESSSSGVPNRVLVCYRDATLDPVTDPSLETVLWRDPLLNRPEQRLIGIQYTDQVQWQPQNSGYVPYVVTNSASWVYAGTGFKDGDSVPGIVGYEADRTFSTSPQPNAVSGTYTLLSHSPFVNGSGGSDFANSSVYQAPSGAWVFATGTIGWSWGLDNYGGANVVDTRLQRATANVLDRFVGPDFALSASPASQTVTPGGSTSYSVTISPTGGISGQVTLSVSGLPSGSNGSFAPNPASASSTLSVTTSASTPIGAYTLTITGVSGTLTHTTTVTLVVSPPPDFTLSASPASRTVTPGGATSYNVTISTTGGFSGQVTLSVSGLPGGGNGSFAPNPASASSTLSVTTSASTPTGTYTLTITGVSGTLTHTTTVTLVVNPFPDFTLSASPATQTVTPDGATRYSVTFIRPGCFSRQIPHTVPARRSSGLGSFAPNPASASSTLSVTTSASTPTGTYTLTITGVSGTLTHTTTVTLVVNPSPDFTLSASPASQTVTPGGATSYNVTISPTGGFSGQVTLSVSGLPGGGNGSFTPNPAGASSTLSVTTSASTPTGTYTLTITGVSGVLTHTTSVTLVVSVLPDFTLSASPASQAVIQGGATSYNVTISPTGGFSGQVTLSVSGLPSGGNGTFSPNPASASSTLSVTTSASTPTGTYTLTITGVSGVLTHTTTVTLVVSVPPDFTLSASPASQAVIQGGATSYNVTISPTGGFSGQVTLSVSGLPGGGNGSFAPNPASASSTLSVTPSASTPTTTSALALPWVSGTLTTTTSATPVLDALPVFTLSASPASQAVMQGGATSYNVTISPTGGFSGQVTLSVSGLPGGGNGSFAPNPAGAS